MTVRAKFLCNKVSHIGWSKGQHPQEAVELMAVHSSGPDDPNKSWSEATPSGQLTLMITNKAAHGLFKVGHEYYLDITEADEPAEPKA